MKNSKNKQENTNENGRPEILLHLRGDRSAAEFSRDVGQALGRPVHTSKIYRSETGELGVSNSFYEAACNAAKIGLVHSVDFTNDENAEAASVYRRQLCSRWNDIQAINSFCRDVFIGFVPAGPRVKLIQQLPIGDIAKAEFIETATTVFELVGSTPKKLNVFVPSDEFLMLFRGGPYEVWSGEDVVSVLQHIQFLVNGGLRLFVCHRTGLDAKLRLLDETFLSVSVCMSKDESLAVRQSGVSRIQFSTHDTEVSACSRLIDTATKESSPLLADQLRLLMDIARTHQNIACVTEYQKHMRQAVTVLLA
ncbi:MAG: hypothetical protein KDA87_16760 [Planctomycetales bacterium]|nr:hypothetical protein [Planctomycetales bacterium]